MIRKIISIVLLISLITTVVAFSKSEDRTISAIADTYTCSLYPNKNHSLDKDLVVSRENGDTKDVYIAFCVGTLPVNDYRILLRLLTVSAVFDKNGENETPGITLSGLADHEWKQSELTFNSVPKKGSDVASFCTESNNLLEVDITVALFRNNIRVGIGFLFSFVVSLGILNVVGAQITVSCEGTVNPVVSCHRAPFY